MQMSPNLKKWYQNVVCKIEATLPRQQRVYTLRPRQYGRHFPGDSFRLISEYENNILFKLHVNLEINLETYSAK